jgi:uncharacterized protein (DUF849 family)
VHVHAFDDEGQETLDGTACAKVLKAIRSLCPTLAVSLTTSATIVSDSARRFEMVKTWSEMPDLVTVNQGEPGIVALSELLLSRGVGLEAGLLTAEDARAFVRSGLADRCRRVLIEPEDEVEDAAVQHAAVMEDILFRAGIQLEQIHHGYGMACWKVNQRALARGHGIRTGLEDIPFLPNGEPAKDNAELIRAALCLIRETKIDNAIG